MNERVSELENEKQQSHSEMEILQIRMDLLEKQNCNLTQLAEETEEKAKISLENSQSIQLCSMNNMNCNPPSNLPGDLPTEPSRSVIRRYDSMARMGEDTFTLLKIKRIFISSGGLLHAYSQRNLVFFLTCL